MPVLNPETETDTDAVVPPATGDWAAATDVDPLKLEAVPYSKDTVVDAKFAFTDPVRDTDVVPTDDATVELIVGGAAGVTEPDALETVPVPAAFVALTRNVYAVPFVKPVTVAEAAVDVPSANVVHVVPFVDNSTT